MRGNNSNWMATVMLTFDDGRRETFDYAVSNLMKNKIPATFSIITAFIEGGSAWPGDIEALPMTFDQLYAIKDNNLFEIADHSDHHSSNWDDIQSGKDKLFQWFGTDANEKIGYTSPGSKHSKEWLEQHETMFREAGFAYARTGGHWQTKRKLRIFCRKVTRVLHLGLPYTFAYEDTLLKEEERYILTAVPVMHDITLHQIKTLIRFAERKGRNCILLLHSILPEDHPGYNDPWVWSAEKFSGLLDFLDRERNEGRVRLLNLKQYASKQM